MVAAPGATDEVRALARALARRVDVRALDRGPDPAAVLAVGADVPVPDGVPVARVADGTVTVGAERIALPTGHLVDTAAAPPLPPHVRRRWRERLGLPPLLVVDTAALVTDDVPTALAVAAAAVVDLDHLPLALALGCPTVTDADAAAAVGALDGVHVVVGERAAADALAVDDHRAAALSWHGRALAVATLDPAAAATAVLAALGLGPGPGPVARLDDRLAELGTDPAAPVRRRAAAALALFGPSPVPAPAPAGGL